MRPRVLPRTRGCRFERVGRRRRRGGQPGIVRVRRRFERPKRRRRRPKEDGSKAHHRRQPRRGPQHLHVVVADVGVRERPRLAVGHGMVSCSGRPGCVARRVGSASGAEVDAVEGDDRVVGDIQHAGFGARAILEARGAVAGEVKVSSESPHALSIGSTSIRVSRQPCTHKERRLANLLMPTICDSDCNRPP